MKYMFSFKITVTFSDVFLDVTDLLHLLGVLDVLQAGDLVGWEH